MPSTKRVNLYPISALIVFRYRVTWMPVRATLTAALQQNNQSLIGAETAY